MCCGSSRPQNIRTQIVSTSTSTSPTTTQTVFIKRTKTSGNQYSIQTPQCVQCGYPTIMVNIANRERFQCSNTNCRTVAQ